MDYSRYFVEGMRVNRREKDYDKILHITKINLPPDILHHIRLCYKYDAIQRYTKNWFEDEVLRELRFKMLRSRHFHNYYLEILCKHEAT